MNCMKCGVEIREDQVFCPECLKVMEAYPVAPGTHVHLPKRPPRSADKKAKALTHAEQIASLKKLIHWLLVTLAVMTAAVAILSLLLFYHIDTSEPHPNIGRNYTTAPR